MLTEARGAASLEKRDHGFVLACFERSNAMPRAVPWLFGQCAASVSVALVTPGDHVVRHPRKPGVYARCGLFSCSDDPMGRRILPASKKPCRPENITCHSTPDPTEK